MIRTKFFLSILLFMMNIGIAFSQVPCDGGPGCVDDPDIPLTGIEWLLLGGGLWGAKKIYDGRKKEKQ